ncbi:hypothetical protein PFFCH_05337 [Plasmodium falciparum FCH/4]|uniref:Erythrocyte membrane protein 1 n=1 Tax=Plasmodium falciparum FCH/4 TaxID=1036724 RepID=A0A024VFC1_PLAFA|nr:hypothetical protein PFFCH_05337 [Plasmodium falciparum FCH/4]
MGRSGSGGGTQDDDAKHMFDRIGQQVHEEVTRKAIQYNNDLHGVLSNVYFSNNEKINITNACLLDHNIHTTVSWGVIDPCDKRSPVRFSDEGRSQCSTSRISGNDTNSGSCAPYRKLQLCDYNLEKITDRNTTNTNNLLVDVLLAAKYEGQSITRDYPKYHAQYDADNPDFNTTICTMLARSFADIGDIIRGKDLYIGNRKEKEKEKLQNNLKDIFKKIHGGLSKKGAKDYYQDESGNYYKLREDWWTANRETVWKALTCEVGSGTYFHATCGGGKNASATQGKCRCPSHKVPTYFDYVPQYLRWFEEWAEDFCRKKKKKLEKLEQQCRGNYKGQQRYCSRNGFDCTKTKRAIGKLRYGNRCIDCLYACNPYVEWMDNKKKEFEKQKKKCEIQIFQNNEPKVSAYDKINNLYYDYFYKELKQKYSSIEEFLRLLNQDAKCKNLKEYDSESEIDFNNSTTTFSGSQYCQPCPLCGVKHKGGNEWEERKENDKCNIKLYRPKDDQHGTTITILKSGEKQKEIEKKLNAFCNQTSGSSVVGSGDCGGNSDPSLCEPWQCYQSDQLEKVGEGKDDEDDHDYENEVKDAGGLCILKNEKYESEKNSSNEPEQFQKTYNDFFNFWVAHMLKDSIHWKKKLDKCINNTNGKTMKCRNGCNNDCECFKKWIKQKKEEEWKKIKNHFKTQDFGNQVHNAESLMLGTGLTADFVLEGVLELQFLNENTEEKSENSLDSEEIQHLKQIKKILEEEKKREEATGGVASGTGKKTIMDKLIEHEEGEAETCKNCKPPEDTGARAETGETTPSRNDGHDDDEYEDEEEEDEDEVEEEGEGKTEEQPVEVKEESADTEGDGSTTTTKVEVEKVNVCSIVEEALTIENLKQACPTKYGPKAPTSWKCIPTTKTTGSEATESARRVALSAEGAPSGTNQGAICVPPRRRKLYLGGFDKFISGETTRGSTPATSQSPNGDLLTAFVESAAVETFFLWHRYKKIKEKEEKERKEARGIVPVTSSKPEELDKKLKEGKIDDEFKRQMFYTLGDYRDILVRGGGDTNGGNNIILNASGNKEDMQKIQKKIDKILKQSGDNQLGVKQTPSENPRKTWWNNNAQHIWNAMVCALTYKDNTDSGPDGKNTYKIEQVKTTNGNGDLFQQLKDEYDYNSVTISSVGPSGDTKLDDFASRPQYFRWLEEWGETFCRKQKHKLYIIKKECKVDEDDENKCSGDGFKCTQIVENENGTITGLDCPGCAKYCGFYKKWIEKKKTEYDEQQKIYKKQKDKCQTQSKGAAPNNEGNGVCGIPEKGCETAAAFLNSLKNGPCSKTYNEIGEDNDEYEIKFDDGHETFEHAKNCKPCSEFKIKCQNGVCSGTNVTCNGGTISEENFKNNTDSMEDIVMRVSDNNPNGFHDLNECKEAHIFQGIKENKWECRKVCGYVVCKPEKGNEKEKKNQIIQINALVKRWVEYFFEDYNKINAKISHCINSGNKSTCTNDCPNKCKCVRKWIEKKKNEWEEIKKHYLKQYENKDLQKSFAVKTFLEEFKDRPEFKNAIKPCPNLDKFEKSCGLNGDEISQKKDGEENDIVLCLLTKLKDKIGECEKKHAKTGDQPTKTPCHTPSPSGENSTLDVDEEDPENKVGHPQICKGVLPEPAKEEPDGTCEEAPTAPAPAPAEPAQDTESEKREETPPPPEAPDPPKPQPQPPQPQPPSNVLDHPLLKPALMSSTIMWSIGIGFAAFTYFYLKVLYIYVYMWGCGCICMCGYIWMYIYGFTCMCFIYILYICIYIEKRKK